MHEFVDEYGLPEEQKVVDEHGLPDMHEVDEDMHGAVKGPTALTDDGEKNKHVLVQVLQKTTSAARAAPSDANESITSGKLEQLREQYISELEELQEMVGNMRDEQFDRTGTCQVLQVFDSWQSDFQHRLRALLSDAG